MKTGFPVIWSLYSAGCNTLIVVVVKDCIEERIGLLQRF